MLKKRQKFTAIIHSFAAWLFLAESDIRGKVRASDIFSQVFHYSLLRHFHCQMCVCVLRSSFLGTTKSRVRPLAFDMRSKMKIKMERGRNENHETGFYSYGRYLLRRYPPLRLYNSHGLWKRLFFIYKGRRRTKGALENAQLWPNGGVYFGVFFFRKRRVKGRRLDSIRLLSEYGFFIIFFSLGFGLNVYLFRKLCCDVLIYVFPTFYYFI